MNNNGRKNIVEKQPIEFSFGRDLDYGGFDDRFRILIVDDDNQLIFELKKILIGNGFDVSSSSNFNETLSKLDDVNPDIVIMDLMGEGKDGPRILDYFHEKRLSLPVIINTCLPKKGNISNFLEMGADDFISKPADQEEIVARIRALLRRAGNSRLLMFNAKDLVIDFSTKEVKYQGQVVELTKKEYAILSLLAKKAPETVTYEEIMKALWGDVSEGLNNRIKYLVFLLRKNLAKISPSNNLIVCVGRKGYRLQIL